MALVRRGVAFNASAAPTCVRLILSGALPTASEHERTGASVSPRSRAHGRISGGKADRLIERLCVHLMPVRGGSARWRF
jgi:hypothetical protein